MSIITLGHGSGGKLTHNLIEDIFYKYFDNDILLQKNDSSILPKLEGKIAVTTDSFVINPIFFNGGDIGKLSVCGTVNDLAMSGAKPLYITVGFIIEEGFEIENLEKIVESISITAKNANVKIVAGDTKVVEKGSADKIYINTTGIGVIDKDIYLSGENAKPGDKIIISGSLGDHGVCIMSKRKNLEFDVSVKSDCNLLNELIEEILYTSNNVKVLRDPTRGGLATTLNEFASQSKRSISINEEDIPVKDEVRSMCEILGLDPLYIANEGKVVLIASKEDAQRVVEVMRKNPMGKDAQIIGEVLEDDKKIVSLKTDIGGTRLLSMPSGELLPRIC
ncbi:hydrogenase expression/formation protein HypE [Tepidibacter hydrothermalis]|uniref:Hydrogenase expression/formation protein HypE n=1 Tax=Tepidibacter hydrothermalis TaxID=3036126 RepID=A0ABY8EJP0_9FIRM|nr:hydrogenase expression/formation protein HypE [Tepidibacter hydrothermalis]WFD12254.1 hydrogenase expression/formation protein HypE [Tepidibacter hydrothermalis]